MKENKMVGISSLLADLAYLHKQSEEKLREIINEIFRLKQESNNLKRKKMVDFSEEELLKIQEFIRLASDNVDGSVWAEYYDDDAQRIQVKLLTAILQKKGMIE